MLISRSEPLFLKKVTDNKKRMHCNLLLVLLLSAISINSALDVPFLQEVSHRAVFQGLDPNGMVFARIAGIPDCRPTGPATSLTPFPSSLTRFVAVQVAPTWERLPFEGPIDAVDAKFMVTAIAPDATQPATCVLAVRAGVLFGAARLSPAPDKIALTSPFAPWRLIGDLGDVSINAIAQVPGQAAVYAVASNHIRLVALGAGGPDACGVVSLGQLGPKLPSNSSLPLFDWGRVTAVSVASALNSVFIGSTTYGTLQLSTETGMVTPVAGVGNTTTSLKYMDSWKTLFVSNDQVFVMC
jgi:hypothetical protein